MYHIERQKAPAVFAPSSAGWRLPSSQRPVPETFALPKTHSEQLRIFSIREIVRVGDRTVPLKLISRMKFLDGVVKLHYAVRK
jgi:hypothetical protein